MSNQSFDDQTAVLIAITDLYSGAGYTSPLLKKANYIASRLLLHGIKDSIVEDKIEFCSLAISALTQIIENSMSTNINARRIKNTILDKDEIDFINSTVRE